MPEEGVKFVPHNEILTFEEMLHVVNLNKPENHGMNIFSPRKCVRLMNSIGG